MYRPAKPKAFVTGCAYAGPIRIRRLTPLDRMRLFRAIGAENSKNEMYLGYAVLAACVAELGGDPAPFPANERHVEAMMERLGDDGFAAVARAYQESFGSERGESGDAEQIKN